MNVFFTTIHDPVIIAAVFALLGTLSGSIVSIVAIRQENKRHLVEIGFKLAVTHFEHRMKEQQAIADATGREEVIEKVKRSISAHKTTFEEKTVKEKNELFAKSKLMAERMVSEGGHRIKCPACGAQSWVKGEEVSDQGTKLVGGKIVERTAMLPTFFECIACGLKLTGHAELHVAEIGGQFTRSRSYDPFSYYGDMYEESLGEEYNNE